MASSWRPLEENFWGSSSIAQCVHFPEKKLWLSATKHRLYALLLSFNHQSLRCNINQLVNYYDRLCALRIPVWSEAVRKEAMGPFTSWGLCWNQRKKRCTRFWQKREGSSKYRAMLVKMYCGIKLQRNNQTSNKKVQLFQYVSLQWFLFKPLFFLCTAESFCLWWKLLTWLTCWNRREISLCLFQATRLSPLWLKVIWPCWRVGPP